MARINHRQLERLEKEIEEDESLTPAERAKAMRELHQEVEEDFAEQQRQERRDELGW